MSNKKLDEAQVAELLAFEAELNKVYNQIERNPKKFHEDEVFLRISEKMIDFLEEFYYIEDDD